MPCRIGVVGFISQPTQPATNAPADRALRNRLLTAHGRSSCVDGLPLPSLSRSVLGYIGGLLFNRRGELQSLGSLRLHRQRNPVEGCE